MQVGEIVVARLARGPSVVRLLKYENGQATVAVGRNRQARLPAHRVLLSTGVVVTSEQQVEKFGRAAQQEATTINLADFWEAFVDDELPSMTPEELADLYWGTQQDPEALAALVIYLDGSMFFARGEVGYSVRSRAYVDGLRARRRREAEQESEESELASALEAGQLPEPVSSHQADILIILRDFAIHGEESHNDQAARTFLARTGKRASDLQRWCFELLVGSGMLTPDEPLELERADIPDQFSESCLTQAASVSSSHGTGRRELTHLAAFTIDDAHTLDRDDALSVAIAQGQNDEYLVGIHITDAGSLVPAGSPLDREADRRMSTLYLPERTINMLPEDLTRGAGSLDPDQHRATISLIIRLDATGAVLDHEITPSSLRSHAALSYEEADQALHHESDPWHDTLSNLQLLAEARRKVREEAGAINLEQPEMSVKVTKSGEITIRVLDRSSPSRRLIGEMMILYNNLLGELCRTEQLPSVYRVQDSPDLSDLPQHALKESHNKEEDMLRRYMVGRRLRPAELDIVPGRHGSIGASVYVQATSPLRRYPDLIIQRQISHFLASGKPLYSVDDVVSVAQRAEVQLRELGRIEGQRKRYWFLKFLQSSQLTSSGDKTHMPAVVLENDGRRKALLELVEYPFRTRVEVPRICEPGQRVTLNLQSVDLWHRLAEFVYADQ